MAGGARCSNSLERLFLGDRVEGNTICHTCGGIKFTVMAFIELWYRHLTQDVDYYDKQVEESNLEGVQGRTTSEKNYVGT